MSPKLQSHEAVKEISSEAVLRWLSRAASYPDHPQRVDRVDTHISWVFLTDRFAYKLKKPVRFEFLDFSTLPLRKAACEQEVRLNRRLAPHVYLGVIPIVADQRRNLHFADRGQVVDWVVKMRRLPAERALDQLIRSGNLRPSEIEELASKLAAFYQQQPPLTVHVDQYRCRFEQHVRANCAELSGPHQGLSASLVKRVHSAQLRLLRTMPQLLDDRVRDGRIIEGHGDLRPEHIYLNPAPIIIDCIEFKAELRQLDVLDELGFLAMECDYLNAEPVGQQVLSQYYRTSGDRGSDELLNFYKCYRACVRAKVAALRADQQDGGENGRPLVQAAQRYIELADGYAAKLGAPLLLVVCGLSGSGKSSLAAELAATLGLELLQTDAVRCELFTAIKTPAEYNQQKYQPQNRQRVYDEMFRRADELLSQRVSVILDGTFLAAKLRTDAVSLAERHGAQALVIHCHCPDETALQRIAQRISRGGSLSEAGPDLYYKQQRDEDPNPPGIPACEVDTTTSIPEMLETVFANLRPTM
jgi:aminoglycoside phosphotransferase family enzyme/predicted kinase